MQTWISFVETHTRNNSAIESSQPVSQSHSIMINVLGVEINDLELL